MNQWVLDHISDDPAKLRLKYGRDHADDILQIECRRKYASKLGALFELLPDFRFPTALSGEQSTSWRLAGFHASLVGEARRVADLTAGLGVDAYAMARRGIDVTAVERDPAVADALRANYAGLPNFHVVEADCRDFLKECADDFDCMFIDPARRSSDGGRVYALADCEPNVVEILPEIERHCDKLVVKASPMLDITHTVKALGAVERMVVLGTPTECKELDAVCAFGTKTEDLVIEAVTLGENIDVRFTFTPEEEAAAEADYGLPSVGDFVYEPYPAVMKSGAVKLLGARFGLRKIAPNTHLWFGSEIVENFPGRAFKVVEVQPYASKIIKRYRKSHPQISVTTRNFTIGADALRAKLGVRDGGTGRLFAVTNPDPWLITTETP